MSVPRIAGLVLSLLMLFFSGFMFLKTGDWVAALFLLGSLAYVVFFFSAYQQDKS